MTQYLEIYSQHRNRQQDPSPSHFSIPFGKGPIGDPLLNGTIYYQWGNMPYVLNAGYFKTGTTNSSPLLDMNPYYQSNAFIQPDNQSFPQPLIVDAYKGYYLMNISSGEVRVITRYQPSNVSVSLSTSFYSTKPGDPYFIYNPSSLVAIQIPYIDNNGNSLLPIENAYAGYYIVDETLSLASSVIVYRRVRYYSAATQQLYLDQPFPAGWAITDSYTLRKSLPEQIWNLQDPTMSYTYINHDPAYGPIGPVITLPAGASLQNDFYKGKYIYYSSNVTIPSFSIINLTLAAQTLYGYYGAFLIKSYRVTYQPATQTYLRQAFVDYDINGTRLPFTLITSGFQFGPGTIPQTPVLSASDPNFLIDNYYSSDQVTVLSTNERQIVGSQSNGVIILETPFSITNSGTIQTNSTTTVIYLQNIQSQPLTDSIVGQTFYHNLSNGVNEVVSIIAYDPNAYTVTLQRPLVYQMGKTSVVGDLYEISAITAGTPYVITTPSVINIVSFAGDNVVPLNYIGTMTSLTTSVCYTITLESLTLPNLTLTTGSQIAFYPYIYVEITNETASESASVSTIYSNNPASNRATFIVPVTNIINPTAGYFVKLNGEFNQTIKFKPNDNFYFAVTLPDGSYFQPIVADTLSPYPPNDYLQIHALFSLKRV